MDRPETFMAAAVAEAQAGVRTGDGGPFGAVVVRNGEIVSQAHNRVVADHDPTAHAEVLAIRTAAARLGRFDLSDCELYTTCEPCPMCLFALLWARIPRLHYGATRADAATAGFDDARFHQLLAGKAPPELSVTQEHRDLCLGPFRVWTAKSDRVAY